MSKSILANIANGAFWTALARLSVRLIGLASTIVLARLLSPQDFGLVAIGMVFISTLQLLGSFDFDTVLIQHPNPSRQHYDTAWTLNALYFTLAAIGLAVFAPHIAAFYKTPELADIIYILSFGFVLTGTANIKIVDFQKHFRFRYDFSLTFFSKIAGFAATVTCAFIFRDYRALLAGFLANRITFFALGYWLSPYLPHPSLAKTKSLFRFSSWLMLKNFFFFINNKSTELIIGKQLGTTELGVFSVGYDISTMPTQELTSTINRASYPGYTKLSDNIDELRTTVIRIYNVIVTIAAPISIGLVFIATPFTYVVLGEKWLPSVPVIQLAAIAGLLVSLQSNLGYVFLALHKPNISAAISGIRAFVLLPTLLYLTAHYGVSGSTIAILISAVAILPINLVLLNRFIKLKPYSLLRAAWRPLVSVCFMAAALAFTPLPSSDAYAPHAGNFSAAFTNLFTEIALGAVTYTISLIILWILSGRPSGFENEAFKWLKNRIARRRNRNEFKNDATR